MDKLRNKRKKRKDKLRNKRKKRKDKLRNKERILQYSSKDSGTGDRRRLEPANKIIHYSSYSSCFPTHKSTYNKYMQSV